MGVHASAPKTAASEKPAVFGMNTNADKKLRDLFHELTRLPPMDKRGPMSGHCDPETTQMERFLSREFGFENIPHQYIVDGVKSFRLNNNPDTLDPKKVIEFPKPSNSSFKMQVGEILRWQSSYAVYADRRISGMDAKFLCRALQGLSTDGEEAFRMKFVVRISTSPILMEFDARVIKRELHEDWPHLIKLVSVTGIDFAGRKHDVNDILYYIANWKDIYGIDSRSGIPHPYNGRDFVCQPTFPAPKLHLQLIIGDLMRMARLRLLACDNEGVQVVVETGIGLGVFAGRSIGIDATIRSLSATAVKTVLEEDGSTYKNIRAVVFALPIFGFDRNNQPVRDTYHDFCDEFETQYKGPIPVLIADQDMHRLTVAIARQGFRVSQLNPADSHGVFGEYWQNRGPAVEEKLALTTLGLLVQHHLINPEVVNLKKYHLMDIRESTVPHHRDLPQPTDSHRSKESRR